MTAISFETAALLAKYVVDNTIPQANIVAIQPLAGRWFLFHF
jgi:hypothetical protein